MSVDKFGRYDHNFVRDKKTPITGFEITKGGDYDAMNKLIRNVKEPILLNDAATKGYVSDKVLKKTNNNNYDCEGKLIQNVGDPIASSDVVTVQYLKKLTPTLNEDHWGFSNKRLSNIKEPIYDGEAVNLAALQVLTVCRKRKIDGNLNNTFDANSLRISNVGDCKMDGDAVNKKLLHESIQTWTKTNEKHLERLGAALFRYIHRSSGRSVESGVDARNYLDWDEIHGQESIGKNKDSTLIGKLGKSPEGETENDEEHLRNKRI